MRTVCYFPFCLRRLRHLWVCGEGKLGLSWISSSQSLLESPQQRNFPFSRPSVNWALEILTYLTHLQTVTLYFSLTNLKRENNIQLKTHCKLPRGILVRHSVQYSLEAQIQVGHKLQYYCNFISKIDIAQTWRNLNYSAKKLYFVTW